MPYTSLARLTMMSSLKQVMTNCKHWFMSEKGIALVMIVAGAFFIAVGIHRFWVRPEHFGWPSLLGCVVAAFGAFFLLLVTDYVFHHAPLVFIPWFICSHLFRLHPTALCRRTGPGPVVHARVAVILKTGRCQACFARYSGGPSSGVCQINRMPFPVRPAPIQWSRHLPDQFVPRGFAHRRLR